jgi:hypothetical protein
MDKDNNLVNYQSPGVKKGDLIKSLINMIKPDHIGIILGEFESALTWPKALIGCFYVDEIRGFEKLAYIHEQVDDQLSPFTRDGRGIKSLENQGVTAARIQEQTVKIQEKSYICTPQNGISGKDICRNGH